MISSRPRGSTCRGRYSATSPARPKPTRRWPTTAPRFAELAFVPRVLIDVSKAHADVAVRPRLRRAVRHRADRHQRAVRVSRRPRAGEGGGGGEHSDDHERLVAHPAGRRARRRARRWFQAYLPGDVASDHRADRARGAAGFETLVMTVDSQVARQPREQRAGRLLDAAAADAAPGVGRHHASALAVRHVPAHARAARHAAFREQLRHARRADPVAARRARLFGSRAPALGALRADPHDCGRATLVIKGILDARDARIAREAGARGHHRVQPRWPPARRRGVAAARAARHRRRVPRHAGDDRRRRAPGHRRAQGAGARREVRLRRAAVRLRGGGRRRSRRAARHRGCSSDGDPARHGDAGHFAAVPSSVRSGCCTSTIGLARANGACARSR